ncbi:hypothetical protein ACLOJK_003392 [Asimina triloba]
MSLNRVHSIGNVPFSWEDSPGISKESPSDHDHDQVGSKAEEGLEILRLPPPPCPSECPKAAGVVLHDLQVPLPPCPFQPPLRSSSKRVQKEDPFLAAYKECTKSVARDRKEGKERRKVWALSIFSCHNSCGIRDDALVKVGHLPDASSDDLKLNVLIGYRMFVEDATVRQR